MSLTTAPATDVRIPASDSGSNGLPRWFYAVAVVLIVLAVGVRVLNLNSPLLERHGFRQTQTAITIWTFVTEGISLLDYQTPVLGPPFQVPFEFPAFQAGAALLVFGGIDRIDVAARLTNIVFFLASAVILFLVCRHVCEKPLMAWWVLFFYLWSPYMIFWSRTSMIDYASVFFVLGYLYGFLRWMKKRHWGWWLASVLCGVLAYLVKVTTVLTVVLPMAVWPILAAWDDWRRSGERWKEYARRRARTACLWTLWAFILFVVPPVIGYVWLRHTDQIKVASPYTQFNTSAALDAVHWTFGTWEQKRDPFSWLTIFSHVREMMLPGALILLLPVGLWAITRFSKNTYRFVILMLAGAVLTIFTFFNLYYYHDYYLMGVSPAIALFAGLTLYRLFMVDLRPYPIAMVLAAVCALISFYPPPLLQQAYRIRYDDNFNVRLAEVIRNVTPPDEYVIICDFDWSSELLYYARRKGLMLRQREWGRVDPYFTRYPFRTVLFRQPNRGLLANWKEVKVIAYGGGWYVCRVHT